MTDIEVASENKVRILSPSHLFRMALAAKGLLPCNHRNAKCSDGPWYSESLGKFSFYNRHLVRLLCNKVGVSDVTRISTEIEICVRAEIAEEELGVRLVASASCQDLPGHEIFKVCAALERDLHEIVGELASTEKGELLIPWDDLSLSGILSTNKLFEGFFLISSQEERLMIESLLKLVPCPFDPAPSNSFNQIPPSYIRLGDQPTVFTNWQRQLHKVKMREV